MTRARWGGRLQSGVLVAVAALSLAAAAAWWPGPSQVVAAGDGAARLVRPADPPSGPIEITGVSSRVTWSNKRVPTVVVHARNNADHPVAARVWWLLTAPGDPRGWRSPVARSAESDVTLPAGETGEVRLTGPGEVPPGSWSMSLWAHTVAAPSAGPSAEATTRHSHGVAVVPTLLVLPTHPTVFRLSDPGPHAALEIVEPVGRLSGFDDATGPDALVSATSTTNQPVHVQLRCYLAEPGTPEPWKVPSSVGSAVTNGQVEPDQPRAMGCRFDDLPEHGRWELSAFLRLDGAANAHEDGLYSRRLVTFG